MCPAIKGGQVTACGLPALERKSVTKVLSAASQVRKLSSADACASTAAAPYCSTCPSRNRFLHIRVNCQSHAHTGPDAGNHSAMHLTIPLLVTITLATV